MKHKNYIDNLRSLVILSLFPYHTLRMYTSAEPFYVQGTPLLIADVFVTFMSVWFMNLLFVLAGMSTYYSIQKRSLAQYTKERLTRLLIPFFSGLVLIIPAQTYFAEKQKNHYTGSYLAQYKLFFTKIQDLSGYAGGFTPGHLWFLLFLFLISIIALPAIAYVKKHGLPRLPEKIHFPSVLLILFFLPYAFLGLWEMGEPIGRYLFCFLFGLLILSHEEVLTFIKKHAIGWFISGVTAVSLFTAYKLMGFHNAGTFLFYHFASLLMILGMLGFGQLVLDFQTKATHAFSKESFSIYFVHQSVLVAVGYYCVTYIHNTIIQISSTIILSFLLSLLLVWLIKKIPILRTLFGMHK